MSIRNLAVIAHVDHGKTTLIDALLKQTHTFRDNQQEMSEDRIMDSNDLERERGITIMAKNCAILYKDTKINIIDTPGHADFSGEVERTLNMAEGALLIIDAQEGPMPQTRFVLKKALALKLKIIVVINKIDKPLARIPEVIKKTGDLFLELAQTEDQLDFPVLYAIGKTGAVFTEVPEDLNTPADATVLLDSIVENIPDPEADSSLPTKVLISSVGYDAHIGSILIGKVHQGSLKVGQKLVSSTKKNVTVEHLLLYEGLKQIKAETAEGGDIAAIATGQNFPIGTTLSDPSDITPLPSPSITPPSLHMRLGPNSSPFAGLEGKFTTSRQIEERLNRELETNLSLKVEKMEGGQFKLSGRGELHLAILLETMRREGFEMEIGKPQAIIQVIEGIKQEPLEELSLIVQEEFTGTINQELGKRQGQMVRMEPISSTETEFVYNIPTRNIIGLRSLLLTLTKGTVIMSSVVVGHIPLGKPLQKLRQGALISSATGDALSYGLAAAQSRGSTFIPPGDKVYEGQIIGQNSRGEDIEINICKGKKLTNMRSKSSDGIITLAPPIIFSLEQSIDFLEADELLEITPKSLRLRKKYLDETERRRHRRQQNFDTNNLHTN
jgi:GTP-binding protein